MGLKSLLLLLNKTTLNSLIFLKNSFYIKMTSSTQFVPLCEMGQIFESKNREVIENYFKASLDFSRLKGTYLGKILFNIIIIGASGR